MEAIIQKQLDIVKRLQTIQARKETLFKEQLKLLRMKLDRALTLHPRRVPFQRRHSWP